ncbi:MAG: aminodeoxychorismate/anthranilate synthase component II [Vulcanimicrobiota bacterium]
MILMIDNYDSFTYNLVQYIEMMGVEVKVRRNDAITVEMVKDLNPEGIAISPGPGRPSGAGISIPVITAYSGKLPILGVCLGHQAIAEAFGGTIIKAGKLMHGKTSVINSDGKTIFSGIANPFDAMRYHSLVVERATLPECLEISAESDDGEIMGLRHRELCVEGIQFHPESIMTRVGKRILRNFLSMTKSGRK